MKYSIGLGYDSHKVIKNRKLYLGGVYLNEEKFGLDGHSDADVVIHSVCDAILSALGKPDIGEIFPNMPKFKNIESKEIAKKIMWFLKKSKSKICNIDIVVICDRPNISKYKNLIIESLKSIFRTKNINIKGKTTEGIKCFKNHIQSYCCVLLKK